MTWHHFLAHVLSCTLVSSLTFVMERRAAAETKSYLTRLLQKRNAAFCPFLSAFCAGLTLHWWRHKICFWKYLWQLGLTEHALWQSASKKRGGHVKRRCHIYQSRKHSLLKSVCWVAVHILTPRPNFEGVLTHSKYQLSGSLRSRVARQSDVLWNAQR